MTADRDAILEKSLRLFRQFLPEEFDGAYYGGLTSSFRYMSEAVVGQSLLKLDGHLKALAMQAGEDGTASVGSLTVRIAQPLPGRRGEEPRLALLVLGDGGTPSFRLEWRSEADGSLSPGEWEKTDITLFAVDPQHPDYDYPERIASGSIMANSEKYPGPPECMGHCTLSEFGHFVDAMDALRPALEVTPAADGKEYTEQQVFRASLRGMDYAELLQADGGIAGGLCRQAAAVIQREVAGKVMGWARKALPEVAAEHRRRGYVWGKKYLEYNDLDDSTFEIPVADGRSVAVYHQNISLISDFFGYVAQADLDGAGGVAAISVTAVNRNSDRVRQIAESVAAGTPWKGPTIRHDFTTGTTTFAEAIDSTDILGTFAFYLKVDHEMVCGGMRDGDRKDSAADLTDFSSFERDDEFDEEGDLPAP